MDEPTSTGRRRRRWLVAVGILVVVLGGVTWFVIDRLRTETTPVSVDEAIAQFERPTTPPTLTVSPTVASTPSASEPTVPASTAPPTTAAIGVAALPQPGVYRFTTAGGEDLTILNNPSRTYPSETPVIIEPQGCGVVVRWTPLEQRTETWEMCLDEGGVRLAGYTSVHEFFDQREERVLVCDPGAWLIPPETADEVTMATCTGSGLTEARETRVVGRSTATVGGEEVEVVDVEVIVTTTGSTTGTTTRRLTLAADDAFPIVWTDEVANTTSTPVGDAAYREMLRLDAVSLQPG